jgi:hypothetical protein
MRPKKSTLEEFKEEFKYVKKSSSRNFCAEFENLYKDSGFVLEEKLVEGVKRKSILKTDSYFREDFLLSLEESELDVVRQNSNTVNFTSIALQRKGSILQRLESNHSEKSGMLS